MNIIKYVVGLLLLISSFSMFAADLDTTCVNTEQTKTIILFANGMRNSSKDRDDSLEEVAKIANSVIQNDPYFIKPNESLDFQLLINDKEFIISEVIQVITQRVHLNLLRFNIKVPVV